MSVRCTALLDFVHVYCKFSLDIMEWEKNVVSTGKWYVCVCFNGDLIYFWLIDLFFTIDIYMSFPVEIVIDLKMFFPENRLSYGSNNIS